MEPNNALIVSINALCVNQQRVFAHHANQDGNHFWGCAHLAKKGHGATAQTIANAVQHAWYVMQPVVHALHALLDLVFQKRLVLHVQKGVGVMARMRVSHALEVVKHAVLLLESVSHALLVLKSRMIHVLNVQLENGQLEVSHLHHAFHAHHHVPHVIRQQELAHHANLVSLLQQLPHSLLVCHALMVHSARVVSLVLIVTHHVAPAILPLVIALHANLAGVIMEQVVHSVLIGRTMSTALDLA